MTSWLWMILGILDTGTLQGLVFFGLALSAALSFVALDYPDLSIEGTFPLGAAVAAVMLRGGYPQMAVFAIAAAAGAAAGATTATFHVRFGMSKLLSGICTAAMLYTINIWIMGNRGNLPLLNTLTIFTWPDSLDSTIKDRFYPSSHLYFHFADILLTLLIAVVIKLMIDFLLSSEFGVALRAVGQSEGAAKRHGCNPANYKVGGLALANAMAAISGAIAAQYQGFADVQMGVGSLVLALAAVILGEELFSRLGLIMSSPQTITRCALVGVIVYQVIFAAILRTGIPPTALKFCAALSLVVVIALRRRRKEVHFSW